MLIKMDEACNLLRAENDDLRRQMESCNTQISNINSALDNSRMLQGKAYDALRERISMRPNILQAHYIAYDSLMSANSENMRALSELPHTSAGVLDTSVSDGRIDYAKKMIHVLEQKRDSAIALLKSNPMPTERAFEWSYSRTRAINSIYSCYDSLINAQHAVISKETETKRRAEEYDRYSATIYSNVNNDLQNYLEPANNSVTACLKTGSYAGTTSWVGAVNKKYNLQRKLRDVLESGLLTDEEYRMYKKALSDSHNGDITEEQLYSDGEFNSELYEILQKLGGEFVSENEGIMLQNVYKKMFDNEDEEAIKIAFPGVDVAKVLNSWKNAAYESRSSLLSNLGMQIFKFGKGQLKNKVANLMTQTLTEFYRTTHPLRVMQAVTVTGATVNVAPEASKIAQGIGVCARTAPFFGCGLDMISQVYGGEDAKHAFNKALGHTAISLAVTCAAGLLFSNPVGLAAVAVFAGTAIVSMYVSGKFDKWYDSTFK